MEVTPLASARGDSKYKTIVDINKKGQRTRKLLFKRSFHISEFVSQ